MHEISPKSFFNFAAQHHELLGDLHGRHRGISEAELLDLIRRHARADSPAATHTQEQLVSLGFLEVSPAATAEFELTRIFANMMDFLRRQHTLTSVKIIQARIVDLQDLIQELDDSSAARQGSYAMRSLNEATDTIEQMRQESANNRDAIVAAAIRARINREKDSLRERYEHINRLWQKFIIPLRDMVDGGKALDPTLESLARSLNAAQATFEMDRTLVREFNAGIARLRRLRRDVAKDFHESWREIAPLYEELQRENSISRGAATILEHCYRQGPKSLQLPQRLALAAWRMEGQLDDGLLRVYLHGICGYNPPVRQPIPQGTRIAAMVLIDPDEFSERVQRDLPINDVLDWLITSYSEVPLSQMLRAFGRLRSGVFGAVNFGSDERVYLTRTHRITAHAMEVLSANDG